MILIIAAILVQGSLPGQWAQFGHGNAEVSSVDTVDIGTGDRRGTYQYRYKMRLTKRDHAGKVLEVKWADSVTCPAVRIVVESMRNISIPKLAPMGVPGVQTAIISDGTWYFMTAPSSDIMGSLTINSYNGSSLANWTQVSLKKLLPCWKAAAL
jgi:hypothetical protein